MKTYNKFKEDLQEAVPLAIMAAPMLPKILGGAAALAGGLGLVHQARKQGEGGRSQPVDYGQGGTSTPRTPSVQRPSDKLTAAEKQKRQALADRKADAADRAREKEWEAEDNIDNLIGSSAERVAASRARARARANQPQVQQRLRKESEAEKARQKEIRRAETRRRMEKAGREQERADKRADMRRRMNQAADRLGLD